MGMQVIEDEFGDIYEEEALVFDAEKSYDLSNEHDSTKCTKKEWSWEDESYYYD